MNVIRNYGRWLASCIIIGSVPGALCWSLWTMLGGFSTFA